MSAHRIAVKEKTPWQLTLAVVCLGLLISGCGAQSSDSQQAGNSGQGPAINMAEVQGNPAFLKRGCDGSDSPKQFCPK